MPVLLFDNDARLIYNYALPNTVTLENHDTTIGHISDKVYCDLHCKVLSRKGDCENYIRITTYCRVCLFKVIMNIVRYHNYDTYDNEEDIDRLRNFIFKQCDYKEYDSTR